MNSWLGKDLLGESYSACSGRRGRRVGPWSQFLGSEIFAACWGEMHWSWSRNKKGSWEKSPMRKLHASNDGYISSARSKAPGYGNLRLTRRMRMYANRGGFHAFMKIPIVERSLDVWVLCFAWRWRACAGAADGVSAKLLAALYAMQPITREMGRGIFLGVAGGKGGVVLPENRLNRSIWGAVMILA